MRQLEAELSQYTDDEGEYPHNHDDVVRPGGMVRLDETDETPRYLGPSSGIAMTRLLMEEAKRYTESRRIADLIPQVRARRVDPRDRMQSVVMGGSIIGPSGSRKSYPARSILPAPSLPSRETVDGLVRIFNDRGGRFPSPHWQCLPRQPVLILEHQSKSLLPSSTTSRSERTWMPCSRATRTCTSSLS